MACRVLTTENFSIASNTLPLRRRPAVSISSKRWPLRSNGTAMASRVVPGRSKATSRSSPSQVLIRVDLPTLGGRPRPGGSAPSASASSSARPSGSGSGRPAPARAGSACPARARPRPGQLAQAQFEELGQPRRSLMPSALLTTSTQGLPSAAQVSRNVVVLAPTGRRAHRRQTPPHRPRPPPGGSAWPSRADAARRLSGSKPPVSIDDVLALAELGRCRSGGRASGRRSRPRWRRVLVRRLNSVDLPTLGRPTRARTGFMTAGAIYSGRKANTPPLRVTTTSVVPASTGAADDRRAVGRQAQQRLAVLAVEEMHASPRSRRGHRRADRQRGAQAAVTAGARWSRRARRRRASRPRCGRWRRRRRRTRRRRRRHGRRRRCAQSRRRAPASTQPTAAWKARAQTTSPTRSAVPTRSTRRSTSLVPRGEPTGTSQRTLPGSGSMPTRRGACPRPACPCTAISTPDCRNASASPGRCRFHRRRRPGVEGMHRAVHAQHEHTLAGHQRRGVARDASCSRHNSRPPSRATSSLSRGDHRRETPIAADAGAQWRTGTARARARGRCGLRAPAGAVARRPRRLPSRHGRPTAGSARRRRLAVQTWRPAILGVTASSGVGLGLSARSRPAGQRQRQQRRPAGDGTETRRISLVRPPGCGGRGRRGRRRPARRAWRRPAPVFELLVQRFPGRLVGGARLGASCLAPADVAAAVGHQGREGSAAWRRPAASARRRTPWPRAARRPGAGGPWPGTRLRRRCRPPRSGWPSRRRSGPSSNCTLARQQAGLLGVGGARERSFMSAKTRPARCDVAGLRGALELVEHGRGLGRLVALPVLPAVPAGVAASTTISAQVMRLPYCFQNDLSASSCSCSCRSRDVPWGLRDGSKSADYALRSSVRPGRHLGRAAASSGPPPRRATP